MRIRGRDRIGLAEADRLVAGEPPPLEHRGLSVLLAAAAAEPFPEELADETAAVAGFARARRGAGPATTTADRRPAAIAASGRHQPVPGPHRPLRPRVPLPRAAVFRVAVGLVIAATGGTAFAAATGSLPANLQEQAHQLLAPLGVPAPHTAAGPSTPSPHANAGTSAGAGQSSASPRPGSTGRSDDPDQAQARELCRAWEAAQQRPHGKPLTGGSRRALAAAAGGEPNIAAYCARILAGQPGQTTTPSQTPTPSPAGPDAGATQPGGGGNQKGKGRPSDHPGKTHGPHSNG